jgi:hypothetical protein
MDLSYAADTLSQGLRTCSLRSNSVAHLRALDRRKKRPPFTAQQECFLFLSHKFNLAEGNYFKSQLKPNCIWRLFEKKVRGARDATALRLLINILLLLLQSCK